MNYNKLVGSTGEGVACGYLMEKGYKILFRNYATKFGELDIITKSPDKTLVFCEVKSLLLKRKGSGNKVESYPQQSGNKVENLWQTNYTPEDNMSASKIKKFKKIAQWYANQNNNLIDESVGYRLDLIAVELSDVDAPIIRHYENIS
ncbi:MAG: YraN family protein [Candidatus Paceibacterota bacterium]|jgi:putative endonuclease